MFGQDRPRPLNVAWKLFPLKRFPDLRTKAYQYAYRTDISANDNLSLKKNCLEKPIKHRFLSKYESLES